MLSMPGNLLAQSFIERARRSEAELRASATRIGRRVTGVACLRRDSPNVELLTGEAGDYLQHLVHRGPGTAAQVVDGARDPIPGRGNRAVNGVAYEGEVARLTSVTIDHDLLVLQGGRD